MTPTFVQLKRLVSISLLLILSTGFFVDIGIYAWFQVEQAYIASELCENRFVPESDCEGHCVLEKKINDVESQKALLIEFKLLSFLTTQSNDIVVDVMEATALQTKPNNFFNYLFTSSIFRPPIG